MIMEYGKNIKNEKKNFDHSGSEGEKNTKKRFRGFVNHSIIYQ